MKTGFFSFYRLIISGFLATLMLGQNATAQIPSLSAVRVNQAPVIDGKLSVGEWDLAAEVREPLHQARPTIGAPATFKTRIYVAYDDDFLYVAGRMLDPEPDKIVANGLIQGNRIWGDDRFRVVLSPFNNQRSGFRFETNANGIRQEALADGPDGFNFDWQAIWETAATIDEEGWVAEIAIPFKTINFDPNMDTWGISFVRNIGRLDEEDAWTSFNGRNTVQSLGLYKGIKDINQGVGLDIVANVIPRFQDNQETGEQITEVNPAVDIFYKFTPSLTGVFTANTDFSTTDVDDQIVNLSRFSVLFPERRDFFLQDADIFSFADLGGNANPFFSRTMGLNEDGLPLDLIAGAKLAGRVGDVNLGLLNVFQEQGDGSGEANLFVGRVSYNFLENSQFGAIITHGDPVSGGNAMTYGADFLYRRLDWFDNKPFELNLYYLDTRTPEEQAGPNADNDTATYGASIRIPAREGFEFFSAYRIVGENYNPAMGFVNRQGIKNQRIFLAHKWRPEDSLFQQIEVSGRYFIIEDSEGELQSENFSFRPVGLRTMQGDQFEVFLERITENLDEDFEIVDGVVIPTAEYTWDRIRAFIDTASFRTMGAFFSVTYGGFFNGDRVNTELGIRYSPSPHFTVRASFDQSNVKLEQGDFTTRVASLRTDVAFDSHWSWITRVQYDNVSERVGINSRIRYNAQPGRDLFLVINQGFIRQEELNEEGEIRRQFESTNSEIAARLTYTFRF